MKRHPALQQLSRDHHQALVLAKHLRDLPEDADRGAMEGAAAEALGRWAAEVAPHFRAEEERLLPLLARAAGADHPAIAETLNQHVRLRALVQSLDEAPSAATLRDLGDRLRAHVRYEEDTLFPAVESALSEAQLARLGTLLEG